MYNNCMSKKKNLGGRPRKLANIDLKQVEILSGLGLTEGDIAVFLGVKKITVIRNKKKDHSFDTAIKRGKLQGKVSMTKALYNNGLTGNLGAQCFYLCNRFPAEWKNVQKIDTTVKMDSPKVITLLPDSTLTKRLQDPSDDISKPPVVK